MTTNYHTPIATGAAANASAVNNPMAELDEAISNALLTEKDGHIVQDEGVDLAQQQRLNFTGEAVAATNTPGVTVVTVLKLVEINYLINGGFDLAQRQTPATLTTITTDKYSADRWRISTENADLQYQRADGLNESGLTSQYFGTFKKITNAGKMMIYQIIEGMDSVPLRGKTVTFQAQIKASSAKTIRMAVLQLQTAGVINTIPGTFVTAYGANTVDPTLGANLAIITAAQSKSVTTTMQTFSVSVTVPATAKNLICAIWTDSQFAANDTLSIAEAGLYASATTQAWTPSKNTQSLCDRYYQSLYKVFGVAQSSGIVIFNYRFRAAMRSTPTIIYPASLTGTVEETNVAFRTPSALTTKTVTADLLISEASGMTGLTQGAPCSYTYTIYAESEL